MGKLDELMKAGGSNVAESMGARGTAGPPPGMDPAMARRMPARLEGVVRDKDAARIGIDRIVPDPDQPREEFDEEALGRLAESLRTRGQLQPIRVRWDEGRGAYVILVGERRWRAAGMAGLATLSCIIVEGDLSDSEKLSIQLIENALREDLRPVEQARAYQQLMDANGWSGNQLAKELHVAQASVAKALALLNLPAPVQGQVDRGELPASVAYEVSRIDTPEGQAQLAERIVAEKLTRDQVADAVKAHKEGRGAKAPAVGRAEFKLEGGCKVVLSGLPDDRPETILARLAEVTRQIKRRIRDAAGEQAA
jgi:ParB family transcriptional regulator, chromosome partitioning protein